jgi:serine/threonine protein kinase
MTNQAARTVGRYEIVSPLGQGGMATVYLARQLDLDRLVALKELSALRQSDPAFTERFLRESRLTGSLSHPNIVTVHDYFEANGTPYIAMEYVPGGSLRPHIGHMSLTQVAGVLLGILAGLDYAEDHHVVHRDLKPENVLITAQGTVKITDFGIAKATNKATTTAFLTAAGTTVGTPNYMAPEQAMGQSVGPWTDLYSLGVIAFELFVGHVPFYDVDEPMAVLMKQVSDPIPPARELNPEVDAGISDWIERLLTKDPKKRIRAAADAADEFEEMVIRLAGPRWRRSSPLVVDAKRPPDAPPGPATPPPTQAARPPMTSVTMSNWGPASSEAPTRRVNEGDRREQPTQAARRQERAFAPTVAPEAPTRKMEDHDGAPKAADRGQAKSAGRRKLLQMGAIGLLTLAILAAAFGRPGGQQAATGPSGAAARPVALAGTLRGPAMSVRVPRGWRRGRAPQLGFPLNRPVAAAAAGRDGALVELGVVRGGASANNALLPATLLESVGKTADAPPARKAVRLPTESLQAWRYEALRPVGSSRELTVYSVPTSAGVATVVCALPPASAVSLAGTCDAIAGSLRLRRATPYPVGASSSYASQLNSTIGSLDQTSKAQEQGLQSAQTLAGQAAAAEALAGSYSAAAKALARLRLSPADGAANATLVRALRGAAAAYRKAARAGRSGNPDAYRTASAAVPAATAQVNAALAAIRSGGYGSGTSGGASGGGASGGGAGGAGGGQGGQGGSPSSSGGAQSSGGSPSGSDEGSDVGDSRSDDPSDDSADP